MFTLPRAQKSNIDTQPCHRVDDEEEENGKSDEVRRG